MLEIISELALIVGITPSVDVISAVVADDVVTSVETGIVSVELFLSVISLGFVVVVLVVDIIASSCKYGQLLLVQFG